MTRRRLRDRRPRRRRSCLRARHRCAYTKKEARISKAAGQITGQQEAAGPGDSEAAGRGKRRAGARRDLYVGAGLSLFGLAVLIFFLDFLFYVGFWRCFTPLAAVFGATSTTRVGGAAQASSRRA